MSLFDRFVRKQKKEKLEKLSEGKAPVALKTSKSVAKKASVVKKEGVSLSGVTEKKEGAAKSAVKTKKKFQIESAGVILRPVITEKISSMASSGKYGFMVLGDANKISIKKAVNAIYGVNVKSVKIINVSGKFVTYGRVGGKTKNWKKAIVQLAPGEKIEVYEGV